MMVKLLLYADCLGVPSSRRIEERTQTDIAFRVPVAGHHPDHDPIAAFRKRHFKALAALFVQVEKFCREAGLVMLGTVALDGTKVRANASKHKAMRYGRMVEAEPRAGVRRQPRGRRPRSPSGCGSRRSSTRPPRVAPAASPALARATSPGAFPSRPACGGGSTPA
jgi:hypothetical protein